MDIRPWREPFYIAAGGRCAFPNLYIIYSLNIIYACSTLIALRALQYLLSFVQKVLRLYFVSTLMSRKNYSKMIAPYSKMHRPGIEPGAPAWQAGILPLNHRYARMKLLAVNIKLNVFGSFWVEQIFIISGLWNRNFLVAK